MFASRNQPYGLDELVPGLALSYQHPLTGGGEPIEAAPALTRLLDPRPFAPAAPFQAIEERIERVEMEHQPPARLGFDQLAKLVAVPRPGLQHGQQEQFGGTLFQFAVERREVYVCHKQILHPRTRQPQRWLIWSRNKAVKEKPGPGSPAVGPRDGSAGGDHRLRRGATAVR